MTQEQKILAAAAEKTRPDVPITEDEARTIVQMRLDEPRHNGGHSTPLAAFCLELYRTGVTRRAYGRRTIDNVLKGRLYPQLKDANGVPFDWSAMPRVPRGRTPGSVRSLANQSLRSRVEILERRVQILINHFGLDGIKAL